VIAVADSDRYLTNWGDDGSIFDRVGKEDGGTPSVKIGLLTKTAAGSSLMAVLYGIIAYYRAVAQALSDLVDAGFDFLNDLVAVLFGDGTWILRGMDLVTIDGPGDYVDAVFKSAEASVTDAALGFLLAFGLIIGLATVFWGVRKYAL